MPMLGESFARHAMTTAWLIGAAPPALSLALAGARLSPSLLLRPRKRTDRRRRIPIPIPTLRQACRVSPTPRPSADRFVLVRFLLLPRRHAIILRRPSS